MEISVIISTHNRIDSLLQTIKSALALDYPADRYEIVIVDNGSTDKTAEAVQNVRKNDQGRKVIYIQENEIGLHNARHAGARASEGDILVFTDDDASFDSRWLKAYSDAFKSNPAMVAAGGPVRPLWASPPPKWLLDYIGDRKVFPMLSFMEPYDHFKLDNKGYFFGVNMSILRNTLFEVGGFNPELIGNYTVGDGESGLCRKIQARKWQIGYVPRAIVYHRIPKSRMTLRYLCRWQSHLAGAQLYARYHEDVPGQLKLLIDLFKTVMNFSWSLLLAPCVRSKKSRLAINIQLHAALGRARLQYINRIMSDENLRNIVSRRDWLNDKASDFQARA